MPNRKGVFVGGYLPPQLKAQIEQSAKANGNTVTTELVIALSWYYGQRERDLLARHDERASRVAK